MIYRCDRISRQSFPAADAPIGQKTGQHEQDHGRFVPQRIVPGFSHRRVSRGKLSDKFLQILHSDDFAAGTAGESFQKSAIGFQRSEFLGGRIMVPYSEDWMDRVDTVKRLQGWTDTSVTDFHYLADYGEKMLLSIRYGNWSKINDPAHAANWARYWRPETQSYIHSYRAVTGVDLTQEPSESHRPAERYIQPSVHLRRRLELQHAMR